MPKIVRVGGNKDFTVIENECLRDTALDIGERGLLVTMLSLPDNWEFSGTGLTAILPCGKTKVFNTLNRLEKAGYLKRERVYQNGKVVDWVYHICGRPIFKDENKKEDNSSKQKDNEEESNVDNSENNVNNSQIYVDKCVDNSKKNVDNFENNSKNPSVFPEKLYQENLFPENQEIGFQEQGNREDNKIYNNQKSNNKIYNNQSIYQSNSDRARIDRLIDSRKAANDYEEYKEIIKDNIEYDIICYRDGEDGKELLDEIVELMAETVAFNHNTIRINGNDMPAEVVKSRFLKITAEEIEYIMFSMNNNTTKINNIRAYLLSAIYNAKSTVNNYYRSEVMHDMYGGD